MADPRSQEHKKEDFHANKRRIVGMVEELIAVNLLEYHNKNWLAGNNKSRCEAILETLEGIRTELKDLNR